MTEPVDPASSRMARSWGSLVKADELVQGFGEQGWIAEATLVVVAQRTRDLAHRVGRLEEGAAAHVEDPGVLGHEVDALTALLVALSDEAVARQPSLAPDVPVVVSLEDAQRRLAQTHQAHRGAR